jgi:hypothetical protein
MVTIVKDKPLIEDVFNYDIIIVGTGIHNTLGNGFQHDIKINFPFVEDALKKTPYADKRKLGTVTVVKSTPLYCLGFIHSGGYRKDLNPVYLDYQALNDVLHLIDKNFENKRIASSFIGCSEFDGNGDKERVLDMFNSLTGENEYFLYDYEQRDYREVNNEKWSEITAQVGKISHEELRKLKDEYIKIRKYGIWGADKQ